MMESPKQKTEKLLNEELKKRTSDDCVIEISGPGPVVAADPGGTPGLQAWGWGLVIWLRNDLLGQQPYGFAVGWTNLAPPPAEVVPAVVTQLLQSVEAVRRQAREDEKTRAREKMSGDFGGSRSNGPPRTR